MIVQHKGKLTIKQIEQISGDGDVLNNFYYSDKYPTLGPWWRQKDDLVSQFEINHKLYGSKIAQSMGEPNCHMRGYESYPGAWVFYDTDYKVRWLVFSDGIRKNPFKGTSYEVTLPEGGLDEKQFKAAIMKFFTHLGVTLEEPLDQRPDHK